MIPLMMNARGVNPQNQRDAMENTELADEFIKQHDPETWFRDPSYDGPCELIDAAKIDLLATELLDFVANVIAAIIDAGSEREAVNESTLVYDALRKEIKDWTREAEING